MEHLDQSEVRRLLQAAYDRNRLHHLALLAGFLHGLRVSETLAIKGRDILDAKLSVKRLKKSLPTLHRLRFDSDPLFDESPLIELAKVNSGRLFDWSRQYMDVIFKQYAALAGLHPDLAHYHVLKHSICIRLWDETHNLSAIQNHVGHKAPSSSLVYMRNDATQLAQDVVTTMSFAAHQAVGATA